MSFIFLEYERLDGHISCHELIHLNLKSFDSDGVCWLRWRHLLPMSSTLIGSEIHWLRWRHLLLMLSTLHLHWKSACQIKGSGLQPLRRSLEKAFPSIIGCSISVSKEKGSGRAWKGFSSLSLYWRKRNCLVVWEREKSQLCKEQTSKPKLRLGQTCCCLLVVVSKSARLQRKETP